MTIQIKAWQAKDWVRADGQGRWSSDFWKRLRRSHTIIQAGHTAHQKASVKNPPLAHVMQPDWCTSFFILKGLFYDVAQIIDHSVFYFIDLPAVFCVKFAKDITIISTKYGKIECHFPIRTYHFLYDSFGHAAWKPLSRPMVIHGQGGNVPHCDGQLTMWTSLLLFLPAVK